MVEHKFSRLFEIQILKVGKGQKDEMLLGLFPGSGWAFDAKTIKTGPCKIGNESLLSVISEHLIN